jgi:hypothetical protein
MQYEIPIGSGFSLVLSAERVDAWCETLRQSGSDHIGVDSWVRVTNQAAPRHRGVSWLKKTHSWRAEICIAGERKHLGYFKDKDMAIRARVRAEQERRQLSF